MARDHDDGNHFADDHGRADKRIEPADLARTAALYQFEISLAFFNQSTLNNNRIEWNAPSNVIPGLDPGISTLSLIHI